MIKICISFFLIIFLIGCSADNKTGIWSKKKVINNNDKVVLFNKNNFLTSEVNSKIKIRLKESYQKIDYSSIVQNNFKIQNYSGNLQET